MNKPTDVEVVGAALYFLPIRTRVPLKFGPETVTSVTCARARLEVRDGQGRRATGWGETPLSVTWVWPSELAYEIRHQILKDFCLRLAKAWLDFSGKGHPMEIGWDFIEGKLPEILREANAGRAEQMPWLAALVCASVFDQALHDAFGILHQIPIYQTYNAQWMSRDLSAFLEPATGGQVSFEKKDPEDFLRSSRKESLPAWHLVGGLDPLEKENLTGKEPNDGYPVLLRDWIRRDGLECLKIKLRGNDAAWDYERLVRVGEIGLQEGVKWFTADFNCTVIDPAYVNGVLDRLRKEHPEVWQKTLYVEQPFPYELEELRLDVRSVSARKPLFLDESAHDWRMIRLGRELGWTGVALKTCKTQTGAILSACWAKAHGMDLMVQDLTNPMLAQIPHLLLAANVETIMGVETNSMQFYPEASAIEAKVHPGIYQRRNGQVNLSSIQGPGFGYRVDEISRDLPEPVFAESR